MDTLCDPTIWGKRHGLAAPYPLGNHMVDTSAAALTLWDRWLRPALKDLLTDALAPGRPQVARAKVAAVAGLHDIGKVNSVFQARTLDENQLNGKGLAGKSPAMLQHAFAAAGYPLDVPMNVLGEPVTGDDALPVRRHEAVSMYQLTGAWPKPAAHVDECWAGAVAGGHHGVYTPPYASADAQLAGADAVVRKSAKLIDTVTSGKWQEQAGAHRQLVLDAVGLTDAQLAEPLTGKVAAAVILLTGLTCLADHLASAEAAVAAGARMPESAADDPGLFLIARQSYFDRTLEKTVGVYHGFENPRRAIFKEEWALSKLQEDARRVGDGLWIVTVPMGEGKTNAAMLRHSNRYGEGVIFALPTRATSDAMWGTFQKMYKYTPNSANLIHQHARLNDFYLDSPESQNGLHRTEWLERGLNRIFAPVAVTTCDQVLLGGLRQKYAPTRLLALANHHIILDEVHTYDHFQAWILRELLAWFGETDTRVTLLSATLPQPLLDGYASAYAGAAVDTPAQYPGHIHVDGDTVLSSASDTRRNYTLNLTLHPTYEHNLVAAHVKRALAYRKENPDQRIAVVVNTVDRAIDIAAQLLATQQPVIVLHSRMTAKHREKIAADLIHRFGSDANDSREGVIVVGTQVIEASLDVDFDRMISDIAPTPSLLQRAGRLWRFSQNDGTAWTHFRPRPTTDPALDIIVPTDSSGLIPDDYSKYPYLLTDMKRSYSAIQEAGEQVHVPTEVQDLVDSSVPNSSDRFWDIDPIDLKLEQAGADAREGKAGRITIPMGAKHGSDSVLHADLTFRTLATVTDTVYADETATRYVEEDTVTVVLYDPDKQRPHAFHGTLDDIVAAKDADTLRAVQAATVPLRVSLFATITGINPTDPRDDWEPRSATLNEVWPVAVKTVTYDDLLGLRK